MGYYYILKGHKVVEVADIIAWAKFFENRENCRVARDEVKGVAVSTVFLGIDHNYFNGGEPLLFETMIFGGPHDEYQTRCSTWEEAELMHKRALKLIKSVKGE